MINEERLNDILKQYGKEDEVLFRLKHKNMLHVDLSPDYPYLEDGSLNKEYVEVCIKKAMEVFMFMEFSNNILVIYEDIYGKHGVEEKEFIESTLIDIKQYDACKLKWKFPDDHAIYDYQRHIYHVKEVDIKKLFRKIILSDIGGKMDLCSAISIIDINKACIFRLYDDRGLWLFALKEEYIRKARKKFE